jgi:glycosyltransferase involved in cell wall biosynthesis
MKTVSILMPVYNAMPFLPLAVNSILNQTHTNFKFIIINDVSTDDSNRYLNSLNDSRITVLSQNREGMGAALNKGLEICNSEFIARMDADDICLSGRIDAQVSFLSNHNDIGILGTQFSYLCVDEQYRSSPGLPIDHNNIYNALLKAEYAPMCHATIVCRTSLLKKIGGYKIRDVGVDWDMYLRMAEISKLSNLNNVYYLYRLHNGQVTAQNFEKQRMNMAFAIHNAKLRALDRSEVTFKQFKIQQKNRPIIRRLLEVSDNYALSQYWSAMIFILNKRKFKGYLCLLWSAFFSPKRTIRRIFRSLSKSKK